MKLSVLSKDVQKKFMTKDVEITGLCTDSRMAERGDVFFCFQGVALDLHDFAVEAVERGAVAVVCEKELPIAVAQLIVPDGRIALSQMAATFYGNPERQMKFIGITGTNGKTTISYMLRNILSVGGYRAAVIGTLGAIYADRKVASSLTTPDPVFLFSLLADMLKLGTEIVVMEVSAHALALKKELPICYEVGIFTNLTRDHLDFFGDMERYGKAKLQLFHGMRCKKAVLNADDAFSREIERCGVKSLTYGLETPADAFALIESETLRESKALLNIDDELCEVALPMTGRHNLSNALAAACAARVFGVSSHAIAYGLEQTKGIDGRLEWVASFHGGDIFVDFAHTPDGLQKSLCALKEHCEGRLILLFGCGGNRDEGKRAQMGEIAAKNCDYTVLTSDNPRYEDACAILAEIENGIKGITDEYVIVEDRKKGTEYAIKLLKQGDILLVAGKGGETYQEIMGIKYDYNDKAVIRSILEKLS